jgi:ferredoxin-fold anticodon binding domain-containing protein
MNKETIQTAQEYLTVATKENGKKKIMDIDQLLENHSSDEVIHLLKTILKEKQVALRDFILKDKAKPEIDETVGVMFRITMAIKTIQNGKEVRDVDDRAK